MTYNYNNLKRILAGDFKEVEKYIKDIFKPHVVDSTIRVATGTDKNVNRDIQLLALSVGYKWQNGSECVFNMYEKTLYFNTETKRIAYGNRDNSNGIGTMEYFIESGELKCIIRKVGFRTVQWKVINIDDIFYDPEDHDFTDDDTIDLT